MPKPARALFRFANMLANSAAAVTSALFRSGGDSSLANDFSDAATAVSTLSIEAAISASLPGPSHTAIQRARRKVARVAADCA